MKILTLKPNPAFLSRVLLLAGLLLVVCTGRSRAQTYADTVSTSSTVTGSLTNATFAADGNLTTAGTINTGLAGTATIQLKFRGVTIPANSFVFIRITNGLTALTGLTIATFTGSTSTSNGTPAGTASSFLTTKDGNSFVVATSTAAFNSVSVTLGGLVGNVDVYYAYYNPLGTGCVIPINTTTSVSGLSVGSVQNPNQAIDGNFATYSNFNALLSVGTMTQSFFYNNAGSSTQSATIAMSAPSSALLNLSLLGSINVQAYNGTTAVGSPVAMSSLLTLGLLNLAGSDNPFNVSINPGGTFNRIDIVDGGVLSLLSGFRVYEVTVTPGKPQFTLPVNDTVFVCNGSSVTLTADNPGAGNELRWYSSILATDTVTLGKGSYTPPFVITTDTVFYVAAGQTGCIPSSERVAVRVLRKPQPIKPAAADLSICSGTSTTLTVASPISGNTYTWYKTSTGGTSIATGTTYATSILTADSTLYLQSDSTNGCSSRRDTVIVTIKRLPIKPSAPDPAICTGMSTVLAVTGPIAGNTYTWYKTSTGGTSIATGTTYTTSVLTADSTIYLQSDSTNGCSSKRDTVIVTIKPLPAKPSAPDPAICMGTSTVLTVTAPISGNTYTWYKTSTGGSSIATGTTYTTSILTADSTIYLQSDSTNSCSSKRDTVIVTVKRVPIKPSASDLSICSGTSTTLNVISPIGGNTYTWYKTSTGGTSIAAGTAYVTSILTSDSTIYLQSDSTNGCSSKRDTVIVTIKPLPAKPSAPDSIICSGTSIVLAVVSPVGGNTYNWFRTSTGGSTIHTGATYTTSALTADTVVYVQTDSTNGCSSKRDTVKVTANPLPSIQFVTPINVCDGITITSIAYTNAQNTPVYYHFAWSAGSISAGFSNDTADISIVNPIPILIPNTANPASYSGNLIIKNAINSHQCPATYPFTLNLVALPSALTITSFE